MVLACKAEGSHVIPARYIICAKNPVVFALENMSS